LIFWDREVVRRTLRRIEDVTGRRWLDAIGNELHFSEWTLYGVFCRRARACNDVAITSDSLCHSYWDTFASHEVV
jgi:methylphosphotriester-DNA--protein-cysteine methyltransferase